MARKKSAPSYAGELAQPIYEPVSVGLLGPSYKAAEEQAIDRALTRAAKKLPLLFKHFDIDPDGQGCWEYLSFRLALAHVPGLQIRLERPPKRGRKRTWQAGLGNDLVRAVQDVKRETGKSTRDAIVQLKKDDSRTWGRLTIQNLETRYREAKRQQKKRERVVQALARPLWDGLFGSWAGAGTPGSAGLSSHLANDEN
jgi:hypothetical protein